MVQDCPGGKKSTAADIGEREKWMNRIGPDQELWTLEKEGCMALYETKDKPNGDPFGRAPVFHVWQGDKRLYCGPNLRYAYRTYEDALNRETENG